MTPEEWIALTLPKRLVARSILAMSPTTHQQISQCRIRYSAVHDNQTVSWFFDIEDQQEWQVFEKGTVGMAREMTSFEGWKAVGWDDDQLPGVVRAERKCDRRKKKQQRTGKLMLFYRDSVSRS